MRNQNQEMKKNAYPFLRTILSLGNCFKDKTGLLFTDTAYLGVQQKVVNIQQERCIKLEDDPICKQFSCKDCYKIYHTKDALKSHTRDTHTKCSPEDLQCTFCNRNTFKNFKVRKEHEKYYLRNPLCKIASCLVCQKDYTTKAKLKAHFKKKHGLRCTDGQTACGGQNK